MQNNHMNTPRVGRLVGTFGHSYRYNDDSSEQQRLSHLYTTTFHVWVNDFHSTVPQIFAELIMKSDDINEKEREKTSAPSPRKEVSLETRIWVKRWKLGRLVK